MFTFAALLLMNSPMFTSYWLWLTIWKITLEKIWILKVLFPIFRKTALFFFKLSFQTLWPFQSQESSTYNQNSFVWWDWMSAFCVPAKLNIHRSPRSLLSPLPLVDLLSTLLYSILSPGRLTCVDCINRLPCPPATRRIGDPGGRPEVVRKVQSRCLSSMVPPFWVSKGWLQSRVHPLARAHGSSETARPGLNTALLYVTAPSLLFCFLIARLLTAAFLPGKPQGRGEPGRLPSLGSHRVGYDWSDLAT